MSGNWHGAEEAQPAGESENTGTVSAVDAASTTDEIFLQEILESPSFDARRAVELLLKFVNPEVR